MSIGQMSEIMRRLDELEKRMKEIELRLQPNGHALYQPAEPYQVPQIKRPRGRPRGSVSHNG